MTAKTNAAPLPIEHHKIIDGFGHLVGYTHYCAFETGCGICGVPILLSPRDQKFLLEVKGVPVKFLRSAAFCNKCRKRRRRIIELKKLCGAKSDPAARAELGRLRQDERAITVNAYHHFDDPPWPYPLRD